MTPNCVKVMTVAIILYAITFIIHCIHEDKEWSYILWWFEGIFIGIMANIVLVKFIGW